MQTAHCLWCQTANGCPEQISIPLFGKLFLVIAFH
jgi:hypothetical protein